MALMYFDLFVYIRVEMGGMTSSVKLSFVLSKLFTLTIV